MRTRQLMFAFLAIMFCFVSSAFAQNVAKVGDTEYATLKAAIGAASSGGKVTLIGNVNENVTISKNLTVDGAGMQYTGTMTINTGLTVTVEKVNFFNAGIVKANGTKGTITVKDCTFDGAGRTYSYAVKTGGATKLTIENCTVKDYDFGFLYNSKSLTTHSVKNVTVENCKYGVRMASTGTTNLVGFVTKDVMYPVQIQANAARTVNMTDCSITEVKEGGKSLSCFDGSSNVTFNFKGTNKFDAALPEDANFVYKEDATDEIENVVIVTPAVAKIGETGYETLSAAVAAAKAGDVITFVADITDNVGGVGGEGITKAITIDGAGHTFTGEMNFKAKVTIKNVNFDGKDFNGYAVETRTGCTSVTIENCTAKNYGYGFLQMIKGAPALTVKNLTVSDVKYGLKIDRSSKVSLEKVNIDASACAVYNSNYAAKTITIKNSKLNNVVTWSRNNVYKTSYVFEGENTVGEFDIVPELDNFKLAAAAKLAAPEGLNVTTVDGYKVVYVNGKYVSVDASAVAKIGDTYYATFAEAYADAQAGETVTLLADLTMSEKIVIEKSITIDGNGCTLTYTGSDRAITVESDANGVNLTVKNLTVDCTASYCQRGINYNTTGALVLEGVTVKGTNVTYALNLPGSSDRAQVTITNSNLSGNIALNVWGENSTINANNTIFTAVDNNTVEGYAAVKLNNDGTTAAEGTVINITGGKIDVTGSDCEDTEAVSNGTATGKVNISDSTVVNGNIGEVVAVIRYANGTSYSFTTIEEAIAKANEGETVVLIRDITASAIITINKAITLDGNGKTLTSTATGITARAINVDCEGNVAIKNLTIDAKGERAINVINKPANVTIEKVTAAAANYTVNVAASAGAAKVAIANSNLTGLNVVNVTASGAEVTINGGTITCNDQTDAECYAALNLTKEATNGKITATGVAFDIKGDSKKASNGAEGGVITIDGKTDEVDVIVAYISYGVNYYSFTTIEAAIAKANAGETVTLLRDVKASAIVTIDKAITLDGNGKTLTSTAGRAINVSGADGVTIKNLTINATGERAINVIQNATNVTIEKVTATAANYTVNVASSAPNAVVAIKESTLNGLCTVNVSAAGANVTVDNSTVNCNDNNTTAGEAYAALCLNKDAVGGSIVATNTTVNVAEGSDSMKGRNGAENGTVTINGSTDGVAVMVAVITYEGSDYYHSFASLAKAVEFAQAGETVTLLRSTTGAGIVIDKDITIDFAGKTYTVNQTVGSTGTTTLGLQILKGKDNDNDVTLKNGTLTSTAAVKGSKEVKMLVQNYANLTVDNMKLVDATDHILYVLSNNSGTVNIVNGSEITANGAVALDACKYASYTSPTVNVAEDVTVNGNVEVSATLNMDGTLYGEVVINGATGVVNAANELTVTTTVEKHKVVRAEADGKYIYSVKELDYVAQIGEAKYEDLAEAFAAAQSGETVTLISDITLTNENAKRLSDVNGAEVMVTVRGNVILDMNGKKITVSEYANTTGGKNPFLLGVFYIVDGAGLTVTGNGTIDVPQTDNQVGYVFWKRGTTGHLVIKNGTFHAGNLEDSMVYTNGSDIVTVEGGTFTLDGVGSHGNGFPVIFNASGNNVRHINVTGGTYNADITKQKWEHEVELGEGCAIKYKGDSIWSVIKVGAYVAESAEGAKVPYSSLAEAVAAAQDGNIVTLAADAEGEGVVINKSITIDFDGNTYSFTEGVGSTGTESNGFQILKGNTVVLKNGTLNVAEEAADKFYILVQNYANLTVEDMNLDGKYLDKWSKTDGDSYVFSNNNANVVIKGETNITANNDGDKAFAFDSDKAANVTVKTTGTIAGKIEKAANATIKLYSGTYSYDVTEYCADRHAVVDNHDDTYTVEALDVDRLVINHIDYYTYENQNEKSVKELVYNRDIYQEELGAWTTLFVPFDVPVKALLDKGLDVAYINCVHSLDRDGDARIDTMYVEYVLIKTEKARLHANTPYMIRADKQQELSLSLVLENATLCKTDESVRNNLHMASAYVDFTLAGVYEDPTGAELKGKHNADAVYQAWNGWKDNEGNYAGMQFYPFEAYLTLKAKPGSPFDIDIDALKSIGSRVVGEEYDGTTYIYDVVIENGEEVTYDLQGRRVNAVEKGIYIKGGNKVLVR